MVGSEGDKTKNAGKGEYRPREQPPSSSLADAEHNQIERRERSLSVLELTLLYHFFPNESRTNDMWQKANQNDQFQGGNERTILEFWCLLQGTIYSLEESVSKKLLMALLMQRIENMQGAGMGDICKLMQTLMEYGVHVPFPEQNEEEEPNNMQISVCGNNESSPMSGMVLAESAGSALCTSITDASSCRQQSYATIRKPYAIRYGITASQPLLCSEESCLTETVQSGNICGGEEDNVKSNDGASKVSAGPAREPAPNIETDTMLTDTGSGVETAQPGNSSGENEPLLCLEESCLPKTVQSRVICAGVNENVKSNDGANKVFGQAREPAPNIETDAMSTDTGSIVKTAETGKNSGENKSSGPAREPAPNIETDTGSGVKAAETGKESGENKSSGAAREPAPNIETDTMLNDTGSGVKAAETGNNSGENEVSAGPAREPAPNIETDTMLNDTGSGVMAAEPGNSGENEAHQLQQGLLDADRRFEERQENGNQPNETTAQVPERVRELERENQRLNEKVYGLFLQTTTQVGRLRELEQENNLLFLQNTAQVEKIRGLENLIVFLLYYISRQAALLDQAREAFHRFQELLSILFEIIGGHQEADDIAADDLEADDVESDDIEADIAADDMEEL